MDGIRRTDQDQAQYRQQMADWEDRLTMYVYELVGRKRIAQFFDAVVEHPDSLPAIQVSDKLLISHLCDDLCSNKQQALSASKHLPADCVTNVICGAFSDLPLLLVVQLSHLKTAFAALSL